jgi:hypothetical protein
MFDRYRSNFEEASEVCGAVTFEDPDVRELEEGRAIEMIAYPGIRW